MAGRGRAFRVPARHWPPAVSAVLLVLVSAGAGRLPAWSRDEFEVLALLGSLLVAVRGLALSGLVRRLARRLEAGRRVPARLVLATWLLSMLVTNDVALLAIVPLTLVLRRNDRGALVILEALAANAGSALTPFGNPQNLFLFWRYHPGAGEFLGTIAPFSVVFLLVLLALSLPDRGRDLPAPLSSPPRAAARRAALGWTAVLALVVLVVVHLLPLPLLALVPAAALFLDPRALRIDAGLLLVFTCFFGIADVLAPSAAGLLAGSRHVFLLSALASQVLGNVPVAVLFADFTADWQALLWGVSVGGFGTLVASFANLIAWRLYVTHPSTRDAASFTLRMHLAGGAMFLLGLGLRFLLAG